MGMDDAVTNHVVVIDGAVHNVKDQSNNLLQINTFLLVVNYPP